MPDGDVFLYEKRLYEGLLADCLWFHPKPQIKKATWKEYKRKKDEMSMKQIEELRKFLIDKKKEEGNLRKKLLEDNTKFGFGCCS